MEQVPAIFRILGVFVVVLFAIRKQASLGSAFFIGSVLLGLVFGLTLPAILRSAFYSLIHPKTLALAAVVSLILVLSHSMEKAGQMERMLDRFQGLIRNPEINLIIFPALIGLLPMPGGAIFSAPMVKAMGKRHALSGERLSFINYWFRHIWEYWWPLYPGVLLATTLARLDIWDFVLVLFPLTPVALLCGYGPLKKWAEPRDPASSGKGRDRPPAGLFFRELAPVLIVIFLGIGSGVPLTYLVTPYGITIGKELGLIAALVAAIGWVWHQNRLDRQSRREILLHPQLLRMVTMVAAILIFNGMLQDSRAVTRVSEELLRWKIPLFPITMILPLLVGSVGGITIAFVGTTFPILVSLVGAFGQGDLLLPYMMLAMVSGFVGVLLSPLHLCLLLSNAYFEAALERVYRSLWGPCLALLLTGALYFSILERLMTR
jgi:uncharacterized protein